MHTYHRQKKKLPLHYKYYLFIFKYIHKQTLQLHS